MNQLAEDAEMSIGKNHLSTAGLPNVSEKFIVNECVGLSGAGRNQSMWRNAWTLEPGRTIVHSLSCPG